MGGWHGEQGAENPSSDPPRRSQRNDDRDGADTDLASRQSARSDGNDALMPAMERREAQSPAGC